MSQLLRRNEIYLFITIMLLCVLIEFRSGQFFTAINIVNILRALIVPGLFSMCALLVIISGGIDVSFPALASLSSYLTTRMFFQMNYEGTILLPFLVAVLWGLAFGAFNGFLVAHFNLPSLIITLGTSSVFIGIMLGVLGASTISVLPRPMIDFGNSFLFVSIDPRRGLRSNMPTAFIVFAVITLIVFVLLRYTLFGRSIYAIGGNVNAATRVGLKVKSVKFFIYCLVGVISSVASLIRVCTTQQFIPTGLLGYEMFIISAVILGGANIAGGTGTVIGTIFGVLLMVIMQNSMLLLGIQTYWQSFFTGMLILIGISISAIQIKRKQKY